MRERAKGRIQYGCKEQREQRLRPEVTLLLALSLFRRTEFDGADGESGFMFSSLQETNNHPCPA